MHVLDLAVNVSSVLNYFLFIYWFLPHLMFNQSVITSSKSTKLKCPQLINQQLMDRIIPALKF